MADFGEKLREARKKAGITQVRLAQVTGLSKSAICNYESGRRTNIALPTLRSIMEALHLSDEWIVENVPDMADKMSIMVEPGLLAADAETVATYLQRDKGKETKLINCFRLLNDAGQTEAVKRVQELGEIPRYRKEM